MNRASDKYKHYLYDLGYLLKEYAREAKLRYDQSRGKENEQMEAGELMAFYRVVALMQQQAEGFGIPLAELRLEDIDPDKDLV
jgi:hypothetical protein